LIRKAITYFFILTALLYGFRYVHHQGLLKHKQGYYAKYSTAFLQSNNYDVIFLGSSRVQMHYNTRLFDSLTGRNSFNLSVAGATPKVAFAALKIYLSKSKAPKDIIYDVDYHNLGNESKEIMDFNNYFPFLSDAVVRNEFSKVDQRMVYFYWNPYYSLPYTGLQNLSTGLHGLTNTLSRTDTLFYKGYFKECLRKPLDFIHTSPKIIEPNLVEMAYLDSIIQLCKFKKCQLHFVSSPLFAGGALDVANKTELMRDLKRFADVKQVSYTDLSSLSFCNRRELFMDHFHMNYLGATLFTQKFAYFYSNNLQKKALKR
jgi:hypothetical protein